MATSVSLPGLDALFREHPRLARKLSGEELRGLRAFVRHMVNVEYEALVFKLRHLQSTHQLSESSMQQTLSSLQDELGQERDIAREFKREFTSLASVLESRDRRHRKHVTELQDQLDKMATKVKDAETAREHLQVELAEKQLMVDNYKAHVEHLQRTCLIHREEREISRENGRLHQEVLRLKMALDLRDRQMRHLADGANSKQSSGPCKQDGDAGRSSSIAKCRMCEDDDASSVLRLRGDLAGCQAELARKCEEVTRLRFKVDQLKQKLREKDICSQTGSGEEKQVVKIASGARSAGKKKLTRK